MNCTNIWLKHWHKARRWIDRDLYCTVDQNFDLMEFGLNLHDDKTRSQCEWISTHIHSKGKSEPAPICLTVDDNKMVQNIS